MKKSIVLLLTFTLCAGLCACAQSTEESMQPTAAEQSVVQNQSDSEKTRGTESGELAESTEPTGETTPWEAEFNEDDYDVFNFPGMVSYRLGGLFGWEARAVREESDGTIEDTYYYPSYYPCKIILQEPDGTVWESWLLDNGYEEGDIRYSGTMIYQKQITPDGTTYETFFDEAGKVIRETCAYADGYYRETCSENGIVYKEIIDSPSTGEHVEYDFYENGAVKKSVVTNSQTGMYSEQENFENGNIKHFKNQSPDYTTEERFDGEGCRTYYYYKDVNYEIELTADETGKLVKVIENGEVKEDAATFAQYAQNYNFRG